MIASPIAASIDKANRARRFRDRKRIQRRTRPIMSPPDAEHSTVNPPELLLIVINLHPKEPGVINKEESGEASSADRVGGEPVETDPVYLRLRANKTHRIGQQLSRKI